MAHDFIIRMWLFEFFWGLETILYPLFGHQLGFLLRKINPYFVVLVCHNVVQKSTFSYDELECP